jgi:Fur family ferric uptake transcriptional regulator
MVTEENMMKSQSHEDPGESGDCRLTAKRRRILDVIRLDAPITADEIYMKVRQDCQINLSTVYRNIHILLQMGLIRKYLTTEGHASQYTIAAKHCQHLLECACCGATVTVTKCFFEQMAKAIEEQTDYLVQGHQLVIYGLCPQCRVKGSP